MRVLYYSAGLTGSGHIVQGLAIGSGLWRQGVDAEYSMLCAPGPFTALARRSGVAIEEIAPESEDGLGAEHWRESELFRRISEAAPDILIVDITWFCLHAMLRELPCRKVFLSRQIDPRYFDIQFGGRSLRFRPGDWDLILKTEPGFDLPFTSGEIEPIVLRNRDEILAPDRARADLSIGAGERAALFAFNGKEGEGIDAWKSFSYLEDEGWHIIHSHNREGGLFPAANWFNAFDLLVCGAGYSAFWEARAFGKEAFFVPYPRVFEDQARRVALFSDYTPESNGADDLARLLGQLD